ncbi:MAG: LytTR family DNA-binding domain-containing protein [Bacteroidia bacterium]
MQLRVIIIDDEPKSVRLLQGYLEEFSSVTVLDVGYNTQEAYALIMKHQPDLVFLDISMPGGNAFELLSKFRSRKFEVIFTTAFDQYALRAFEENALNYLLKPIDHSKLESTIQRCLKVLDKESTLAEEKEGFKLSIPAQYGYDLVDAKEIIRCEGEGNYTRLYTVMNKKYLVSQNIKIYEEKLVPHGFFRVHKRHLINLAFVDGFSRGKGGYVTLLDGTEVAISFRKKSEFVQLINEQGSPVAQN